jgi:ectoine hydroxylase
MKTLTRELYPSRLLREPLLARRHEPVIWSDGPGPSWLAQDALAHYERNGFLVLPDFLAPSEVHTLQCEMTALLARHNDSEAPFVVRELGSTAVRSLFHLPALSETYARLARHPRLLEFAKHVLGSPVYLHQSRLNCKPGFEGKEFFWHSDFETWHVEDGMPRMRALSCSILLSENNEFNGPLYVVPGSHKTYIGCVGATPEDNYKVSLVAQSIGTPPPEALSMLADKAGGLVSIKGGAGTVVFFDCNLQHGSAGNISPYPRANVFMVYNSVENCLVQPRHGLAARPEHIAHRRHTTPLTPADGLLD